MADVSPGGFASAYSAASAGDTLELLPGTHVTSGRQLIAKRLIIKAKDWNASTTPGKYVTGPTGHNLSDFAVRWEGGWTITADAVIFRGIAFEGRMTSGPGSIHINANSVTFEDCRFSDGWRWIMCHISTSGGGSKKFDTTFRRCRFRQIGARGAYDHCIYGWNAGRTLVEDCIFYEHTGWAFHWYGDTDDAIVRRCVVDRTNAGITFSGYEGDSSMFSTNNVVEDSIFTNPKGFGTAGYGQPHSSQTGMLAQTYYPHGSGVNYLRRSDFWAASYPVQSGRIQATSAINVASSVINANPLYANPTAGDFTLASNSPALGMGPTQIQPGGSPPPPPLSPTFGTPVPGNTQIALNWTNPASGTYTSIRIRRGTTSYPTLSSGTEIYNGTGTSFTDTGLTNGTEYRYSAWAENNGVYSITPSQTLATPNDPPPPPPPPPSDPTDGAEHFGKTTVGGTWRGMSPDYKRASRFTVPSSKRITGISAYLRGIGTSGTQAIRAFAYDDASGALLGTCTPQNVSNTLSEQWVHFTPSSPFNAPSNGGLVRLGLHTTSGDVQVATDVVTGALAHGADTYADGTDSTWTSPASDQYELSIFAFTENVPVSGSLAAASTWTWLSSGNATEVGTPSAIPASDVVYRMDTEVITYQIPTPYQLSTGAKLRWDSGNSKFVYAEE